MAAMVTGALKRRHQAQEASVAMAMPVKSSRL
jgi:hypothetical protein